MFLVVVGSWGVGHRLFTDVHAPQRLRISVGMLARATYTSICRKYSTKTENKENYFT